MFEIPGNTAIADQKAAIEKRRIRLHMALIEFLEVVGMADLVSDFELEIPQGMQDGFDCFLVDRVLEEEQKIDVGLRVNNTSPIAANGEERKVTGRPPVEPELPNDIVNPVAYRGLNHGRCRIGEKLGFQVVEE